jgi:hypothetical protein
VLILLLKSFYTKIGLIFLIQNIKVLKTLVILAKNKNFKKNLIQLLYKSPLANSSCLAIVGRHISVAMSSGVVLGRFVLRPFGSLATLGRRGISGKALRDPNFKRPAPWPYKEKKFTFLHGYFLREKTTTRMDENSKIVVVDGPIASGRSLFSVGH